MKILFIDNDKELISLFYHIDEMEQFSVKLSTDSNEVIRLYKDNNFDIVIINFSLNFGKESLEYILKNNPKQRIITISEELSCSEEKGGDYCQEHYNKLRLLKPVEATKLFHCIMNFDTQNCDFKDKFSCKLELLTIMDEVVKRFYGVKFDSDKKVLSSKQSFQIIEALSLLDRYKIKYKFLNENQIKILD